MNLIAHRGLQSRNIKENTLLALTLGNKNKKIKGIEFDVRLTKDNEVVIIHDDTIDRTSNGSGKVSEMTLFQLKKFNYGTFFRRSTINTLDEILSKLSSNSLIIIELKNENERNFIFTNKVIQIINSYPNLNIYLQSFNKDIVEYLKKYSNHPVGILISNNNIEFLAMEADFYSISKNVINRDIVLDKLNNNKQVMVWTVNTKKEMQLLQNKIGILIDNVYIISDNPFIYFND